MAKEIDLPVAAKAQYEQLFKSAHELERTIGNTHYRLHKLCVMRKEIDEALKQWWDIVIEELHLDKGKDYQISNDGRISIVGGEDIVKEESAKKEEKNDATEDTSINLP